jgi:hypothetical protein
MVKHAMKMEVDGGAQAAPQPSGHPTFWLPGIFIYFSSINLAQAMQCVAKSRYVTKLKHCPKHDKRSTM